MRLDRIQFFKTLADCHFAHFANNRNVMFALANTEQLAHKIDNPRRDRIWRVVGYQIDPLHLGRNKLAQHSVFTIDVKLAAIAINKCARHSRAQPSRLYQPIVSVHIVHNIERQTASVGCACVVQIEYFRNFVGGSRAPVQPTRYVDGRRLDPIAIASPKHLLFGNILVNRECVVDEDFGDARIVCHGAYVCKLVI